MFGFIGLASFSWLWVSLVVLLNLFILSRGANLIDLLLYIDNIVVTSNNSSLLDGFIGKLT